MNEISPSYICAEFCPLGKVFNGNFAAMPKLILEDALEQREVPDQRELNGLIERLDACKPELVGRVAMPDYDQEIYECSASTVGNRRQRFIL